MLGAQPLTQPLTGVSIYCPIGFADWSQTEIVGPPDHHPVEPSYHRLGIQQGLIRPVSLLIASQIRITRFLAGTVPK